MIQLERRIDAFARLGEWLRDASPDSAINAHHLFGKIIKEAMASNSWFTKENILKVLINHGEALAVQNLSRWIDKYSKTLIPGKPAKRIGVVMAGNIPMVGFHDFFCVLISGNQITIKLSTGDDKLLPAVASRLTAIEPEFEKSIEFAEGKLENFDAVIATGSNNTSRYFDYYFRNKPHLIRKNRNGVAVLTGNEKKPELDGLGEDIIAYFGLGCRSVAKIFIPTGYNIRSLLESFNRFKDISNQHKYCNNYEYYKSIFLINGEKHFDTGFMLLKEDSKYSSPPAVVYYEEYSDLQDLLVRLQLNKEQIQCTIGSSWEIPGAIPFGCAQMPELWDYADDMDTMDFLLKL